MTKLKRTKTVIGLSCLIGASICAGGISGKALKLLPSTIGFIILISISTLLVLHLAIDAMRASLDDANRTADIAPRNQDEEDAWWQAIR